MITNSNLEDYHIVHLQPFSQTAVDGCLRVHSHMALIPIHYYPIRHIKLNRQLGQRFVHWFILCKCSSSYKSLRISTLLVSPSTKDINMSLCSFYNCSSFWTSFKASSRDVNCILTSASYCANIAHFFYSSPCSPWICTSLFLNTLNSSSMQAFSKIHTPHSRSNFW